MRRFRCRGKWRANLNRPTARSDFDIELIKPRRLSRSLVSLLSVLLILRTTLGIVLLGRLLLAAGVGLLIRRGVVFRLRCHYDLDSVHRLPVWVMAVCNKEMLSSRVCRAADDCTSKRAVTPLFPAATSTCTLPIAGGSSRIRNWPPLSKPAASYW